MRGRTRFMNQLEKDLSWMMGAEGASVHTDLVIDFVRRTTAANTQELRRFVSAAQASVLTAGERLLRRSWAKARDQRRWGGNKRASDWSELYIFDADSLNFKHCSEGALRNIGYAQGQLGQMTPLDIKPLFTRLQFVELVEPLRSGERSSVPFQTYHLRRDGSAYKVGIDLQFVADPTYPVFVARGSTTEFLVLRRLNLPPTDRTVKEDDYGQCRWLDGRETKRGLHSPEPANGPLERE